MRAFSVLWILTLLGVGLGMNGCGSIDLSLVNEVKRFEPEWMNLSAKVTFIERNLNLTKRRYRQDLKEVDPYISNPSSNERNDLFGLKSQYMNVISARDQIQEDFVAEKENFVKAVEAFNEWVNELMQNDLSGNLSQQFADHQKAYAEINANMDALQDELLRNITEHNSILKRITGALKLYTNYDIIAK